MVESVVGSPSNSFLHFLVLCYGTRQVQMAIKERQRNGIGMSGMLVLKVKKYL